MIALGSAALLVGYLLLFAAVTGHEYTRNPLAGLTGGSSSSGQRPSSGGNEQPRSASSTVTRPGAQIV